MLDDLPAPRILDVISVVFDPQRALQIPFQVPAHRRVREPLERLVYFSEQRAKTTQEFRCVRIDFSKERRR